MEGLFNGLLHLFPPRFLAISTQMQAHAHTHKNPHMLTQHLEIHLEKSPKEQLLLAVLSGW